MPLYIRIPIVILIWVIISGAAVTWAGFNLHSSSSVDILLSMAIGCLGCIVGIIVAAVVWWVTSSD